MKCSLTSHYLPIPSAGHENRIPTIGKPPRMNLANADSLRADLHSGLKAVFILANLPSNMSNWIGEIPAPGSALEIRKAASEQRHWIQHFIP